MYHVSAQGVDECMINVHYYHYVVCFLQMILVRGGGGGDGVEGRAGVIRCSSVGRLRVGGLAWGPIIMSKLIMISFVCFYFLQGVFLLSLCTSSSPFHALWARPVSVESVLRALKINIPFYNTFSVLDPRTARTGQWSPLWTENQQPPRGNCTWTKPQLLSTA